MSGLAGIMSGLCIMSGLASIMSALCKARKDILDTFATFQPINISAYQLVKLLVTNLKLLPTKEYLVKDSFVFTEDIVEEDSHFFNAGLDIEFLVMCHWQKPPTFALIQFPAKLTI